MLDEVRFKSTRGRGGTKQEGSSTLDSSQQITTSDALHKHVRHSLQSRCPDLSLILHPHQEFHLSANVQSWSVFSNISCLQQTHLVF